MSCFFEKIASRHFNDTEENVNTYPIAKVTRRFNNIFPHIQFTDHFLDRYDIVAKPLAFDFVKKYLLVKQYNIHYIKLRLKDADLWDSILSDIFQCPIYIVKDYESKNKPIRDLYRVFTKSWKIPRNFLEFILKCPRLNYYYSPQEVQEYADHWNSRIEDVGYIAYTTDEFRFYSRLCAENCHIDYIQNDHYIDEGCVCKPCTIERIRIRNKVLSNITLDDKLDKVHHNICITKYETIQMHQYYKRIKYVKPKRHNNINNN